MPAASRAAADDREREVDAGDPVGQREVRLAEEAPLGLVRPDQVGIALLDLDERAPASARARTSARSGGREGHRQRRSIDVARRSGPRRRRRRSADPPPERVRTGQRLLDEHGPSPGPRTAMRPPSADVSRPAVTRRQSAPDPSRPSAGRRARPSARRTPASAGGRRSRAPAPPTPGPPRHAPRARRGARDRRILDRRVREAAAAGGRRAGSRTSGAGS